MERSSQRAVQLFRRTRDFLVRTAPTAAYGTIGALVAAANAMANAGDAQKGELVAGGLPADFVEQLRRAGASVLQAIDQRAEDVARRSAAAAAVQGEVVRGRSAMSVLDAMVGPRFEGEFEVSAEWRSLMRQGRVRRVTMEEEAGGVVAGAGEPGPGVGVAA